MSLVGDVKRNAKTESAGDMFEFKKVDMNLMWDPEVIVNHMNNAGRDGWSLAVVNKTYIIMQRRVRLTDQKD